MKKKELKNLAQKIAQIEMDDSISNRRKQEQMADLMKGLNPKELFEISGYVEKIINKSNEIKGD